MGGELDGKQGSPQGQAGALDAQGQAPAQQQGEPQQQTQGAGATNADGQDAPDTQGAAQQASSPDDAGRLAQYEKRIAELESQVAEAARSKEAEARLTAEIEALKKDQADQQVDFSLERTGTHNVKAARLGKRLFALSFPLVDGGGHMVKLRTTHYMYEERAL